MATILSAAAESIPGLTCRGCRFPNPGDPAHIAFTILVRLPARLPEVASQVRRTVAAVARQQLGLRLAIIDVTVEDILAG